MSVCVIIQYLHTAAANHISAVSHDSKPDFSSLRTWNWSHSPSRPPCRCLNRQYHSWHTELLSLPSVLSQHVLNRFDQNSLHGGGGKQPPTWNVSTFSGLAKERLTHSPQALTSFPPLLILFLFSLPHLRPAGTRLPSQQGFNCVLLVLPEAALKASSKPKVGGGSAVNERKRRDIFKGWNIEAQQGRHLDTTKCWLRARSHRASRSVPCWSTNVLPPQTPSDLCSHWPGLNHARARLLLLHTSLGRNTTRTLLYVIGKGGLLPVAAHRGTTQRAWFYRLCCYWHWPLLLNDCIEERPHWL